MKQKVVLLMMKTMMMMMMMKRKRVNRNLQQKNHPRLRRKYMGMKMK